MNLTPFIGAQDPLLHAECLLILTQAQQALDAADLKRRLPTLFEASDSILASYLAGTTYPPMYAIINPVKKQMLTVCIGVQNQQQANKLLEGWETPLIPGQRTDTIAGALQPFQAAARSLIETIGPVASFVPLRFARHIGHSFGGATSEWLGYEVDSLCSFGCRPEVITYGAPKSGIVSPRTTPDWRRTEVVRVFDLNDPVPLLPIRYESGDLSIIVPGTILARKWSHWFQVRSGWTLNTGATVLGPFMAPFTPGWGPLVARSLATWLLGVDCFGNLKHSVASYSRRLGGIQWPGGIPPTVADTEGFGGGGTWGETVAPPRPITVREANHVERVAVGLQGLFVEADPSGFAAQVAAQIVRLPEVRYRGVIRQGTNWVYYGEQPITPVRTRRMRRALVRQLNRTLSF